MTDTTERYEAILSAVWPSVRRAFNYPLVRRARLSDGRASGDAYRWQDDEVVLSTAFLERLDRLDADVDRHTTVETLLKHEVGHYVLFPRELARHLRYLQRATETFGEGYGDRYYSLYADVCVDLRLLGDGYVDTELLDLRERALELATATAGSDVEATVQRRVHRLLLAIYQETFADLPDRISPTAVERSWLDPFLAIDYFVEEPAAHERNVVRFGNALERVLADVPERGVAAVDSPFDEGKGAAARPFGGTDPATLPEATLDEALSKAAEGGSYQYERLRDFLEARAGFEDPLSATERDRGGAAGVEPGEFERHDDLIPFYRRWARNLPLYVTETPTPADEAATYRSGRRPFESTDPVRDVDPFASFGVLGVPEVTKVHRYAQGAERTRRRTVPDLLVGIDSSASMPDPTEDSPAVLAAFLLAATYRRRGARVGGYNFSTEVAFLPPTTDRGAFDSLACAYWGGGTAFDRETLAEFVANMADLDGLTFSSGEAYERLLERIDAEETAAESAATPFEDQRSIDHALITDGNLVNRSALVETLRDVPAEVRTFVFVTDPDAAETWDADVEDAWVYSTPDASALADRVLGLAADRLAPADDRDR
jgi:hypothetical protein